jgi:hypothetical protein
MYLLKPFSFKYEPHTEFEDGISCIEYPWVAKLKYVDSQSLLRASDIALTTQSPTKL